MDDVRVTSDGDAGGEEFAAEGGAGGGDETGHAEADAGVDAHCFFCDGDEVGEGM